ncbi:uncharacterized protein BDZ99DRAFT_506636 [Mytilinidion resinicola]|uniref:AB hydrolase-1 domain-containing protein n=1 Tax=Mytilinidion resinicola TaxID=574789 RepID=A0A6A6Z0B4_9PEZI|nr:uncharacterized protein BDZ99DRAFT_506636 [Mytilinidion resinicola]KAF2813704.1 hypothetical protein BDZ99DRAFT_506636 [Mytilinidion resinicola]
MIFIILIASFLALARSSLAYNPRPCIGFKVPVEVQANNSIYDIPRVDSNVDAVDLVRNLVVWSGPNATSRITAPRPVHQTFSISARLCVPDGGAKASILQIATHDTNSYVNAALKAGYSILIYDRLGVGQSDKPDAYEILQAPLEVEILHQLTILARSGQLVPSPLTSKNVQLPKFDKIVLVGHSFGTAITSGAISKYGDTIDGAVLTAFVYNKEFLATGVDSYGWEHAPESDHKRFSEFPSGVIVQGTVSSVQQIFMKKGAFEPDMLDYAEEVKQPAGVGELLSVGMIWPLPAPAFSGPLLIALAEFDFPVCRGDCKGVVDLSTLGPGLWPKASDISLQIHPNSGHGLTLHRNSTGHFQVVFSYLNEKGL